MTINRDAIAGWLKAYAELLSANKDYLTELDSAIGDADHGINMNRGFQAVLAKLPPPGDGDIGAALKAAGMTLVSTVGGASGPLYGTLFLEMARVAAGKLDLAPEEWAAAVEAGVDGVVRRGRAAAGDKTMLDCLLPAVQILKEALAGGASWSAALRLAEEAGRQGMEATVPLVARKGRASYLGERSAGHQDPGATSAHLMLEAAVHALGAESA